MKLFIVENEIQSITSFIEAISQLNWSHYLFPPGIKVDSDKENIRKFLKDVCEQRPDVVVLDAALTIKEHKLLDELELGGEEVSEDSLSSFMYCRALASEHLGIPIVFLTKYAQGQVARTAMQVGADRVFIKKAKNEHLIRDIEELVKSRTPHDPAFYWPMRGDLDTHRDMWQGEILRKALNRFFLNASSVRRFGMFTASLRDILSPFFQGDVEAEKKLMLGLVKSQVLLSLVDPRLRDHVKHTGNVFWMGYRLLHDISEFREPISLPGYVSALYDLSGDLLPREQLLYAWTLASLFHDFGYVDERQTELVKLVTSLVPDLSLQLADVRNSRNWTRNMHLIRDFVSNLKTHDHFLYHFIDSVISAFGSKMECRGAKAKDTALLDHGFLSAHRFLDMIPLERLDNPKRAIVLHAALAIACHNYVDMLHKWNFAPNCNGNLLIGTFPACSILAFCDNVQTWERELEVDPALIRTEAYDNLLERLVLSDTAYVSDSEICEFSIRPREVASGYDLKLRLRYFVGAAGNIEKVCESLAGDIQRWIDLGRLQQVCGMTGLSSLLHGEIVYELPMLSGRREITF